LMEHRSGPSRTRDELPRWSFPSRDNAAAGRRPHRPLAWPFWRRRIMHCDLPTAAVPLKLSPTEISARNKCGSNSFDWRHGAFSGAVFYLCQGGGYAISAVCVISSVCVQDYCKSKQPISLKLGIIIEPINFWWWSEPGYRFRITFPFSSTLQNIGNLRIFLNISHTVAGRF